MIVLAIAGYDLWAAFGNREKNDTITWFLWWCFFRKWWMTPVWIGLMAFWTWHTWSYKP